MRGLFVYGTLHPDRAPAEVRDLTQRFVAIGAGTVMGRLLNLGEYPGLVLDRPLEPTRGEVFAVPDDAWPALDAYEGFDANHPDASLFVRQLCAVQMNAGAMEEHWVYVFRGGSPGSTGN